MTDLAEKSTGVFKFHYLFVHGFIPASHIMLTLMHIRTGIIKIMSGSLYFRGFVKPERQRSKTLPQNVNGNLGLCSQL